LAQAILARGMTEPPVKARRKTNDTASLSMTMPTVTVTNLAGRIVWGPQQMTSNMKVAELACQLDRPLNCPGVQLVCGDRILEAEADLASLGDPVDLQVTFNPPKPLDHSFVHKVLLLARGVEDKVFFDGDVISPSEVKIPNAEVVSAEVADNGMALKLNMRIASTCPLVQSSTDNDVTLKLEKDSVSLAEAQLEEETTVIANVLERAEDTLLEAVVPFNFDECYDLQPIDGKVEQLYKNELAKVVREGVTSEGGKLPSDLTTRLNECIDELKANTPADYHPGSNNVVRDLVHPSLYPYVRGVSQTTGSLSDVAQTAGRVARSADMWGRPYETSEYQWLPAEVKVDTHGKCTFETYINNLDKSKYLPLYGALEDLLSRCIWHLEGAWAHGSSIPAPEEDDMDDFNSDCSAGDPEHLEVKSLRDRTIQVITKIVDYELPGGATHEGVWHVEGMSHENIVATAELILQKDASLTGGNLEFQRAFTANEGGSMIMGFPQCRPRSLDSLVERQLVPLGHLPLPVGQLACWPNSHIHRVTQLKNTAEELATRRIVVFWLVNPDVRIVSTKHVPPQQGVMSLDAALRHREELMRERKYEKQKWNLREVTLCEH